jgi:hypothetical protein
MWKRATEYTTISVGLRDMVRYEDMAVARIEQPMGGRVSREEEAGL